MQKHKTLLSLAVLLLAFTVIDYFLRTSFKTDSGDAISSFSKELERNPGNASARLGLAQAYQSKNWQLEALKQYDLAIAASQEILCQAHVSTGAILEKEKQLDEARRHYKACLLLNPNQAEAKEKLKALNG